MAAASASDTRTRSRSLSDREKAILRRLRDDFDHYSSRCLRIRTKEGAVLPLTLNTAQRYIHDQAEDQRKRLGWVRKIILKGRQQGCSTYVEGRFFWRVTHRRGVSAFILTHEQEATNNIFGMASRFYEHCPELVRPRAGAANAKELLFDLLDSGYRVGTAGTRGVGRSSTVQYFHGSEVAYWPHAETHASGVMQAVPGSPDTEIWLESTANGRGNYFHTLWNKAQAGDGDYEPIFIPWYWQREYRRPPPDGFRRTHEEEAMVRRFGIDDSQLAWRRAKLIELDIAGGDDMGQAGVQNGEERFRQEYPSSPDEAFDAAVIGAFYSKEFAYLDANERIRSVPWEPRLPVSTAWDLGRRDSTAIWFYQQNRDEVRVIDFYENSGVALGHYAAQILERKSQGWAFKDHWLPHDAAVEELISDKSRTTALSEFGIEGTVLPALPVSDGIQAVRALLPRCWFDAKRCGRGLEALRQYRREYDDKLKSFKASPLHDWASHPADAFRYLAMGIQPWRDKRPDRDRPRGEHAWMG